MATQYLEQKCSIAEVGHKTNITRDYSLNDCSISKVTASKDLGVSIDNRLKFSDHINYITSRAHARASLIHKFFLSRDRATLVRAFITYVRPILEYASSVWSPHQVADVRKIESVQRRFTKRLPGLTALSYTERLAVLELDNLELRRLRLDLILAYKIVFRLGYVDFESYFTTMVNSVTRGYKYKLYPNSSRLAKILLLV